MTATASRTTNRRPELLAPAGGPEPFAAALAAGADAIYCGMGSFNARRKATNFTDEAFEQACRAAHLAGSRVYVTVNIVIKQSEMGDALQLIHRCSTLGADAFIIQDWGLFFEVKRTMPGIETHISTQANIHDDRGTLWCREQGADRVTLSRELSIDEIAAIHDAAPDGLIVGRLVDRGLHDEQAGTAYAVVDGADGRTHHLRFDDLDMTGDARPGAIVEVRRWSWRKLAIRRESGDHSTMARSLCCQPALSVA